MQFTECIFYRMINGCAENHRLNILTNFLWEIIAVLSQQFATVPSCAYASCQSEKVQMLLVPGGLVNRLHRLPPSCYSFCLAPPSLRLTVCACCQSTRGYIFSARHQTVTCALLRLCVSVLLQRMFESALLVKISFILPFFTVYKTLLLLLSLPVLRALPAV